MPLSLTWDTSLYVPLRFFGCCCCLTYQFWRNLKPWLHLADALVCPRARFHTTSTNFGSRRGARLRLLSHGSRLRRPWAVSTLLPDRPGADTTRRSIPPGISNDALFGSRTSAIRPLDSGRHMDGIWLGRAPHNGQLSGREDLVTSRTSWMWRSGWMSGSERAIPGSGRSSSPRNLGRSWTCRNWLAA